MFRNTKTQLRLTLKSISRWSIEKGKEKVSSALAGSPCERRKGAGAMGDVNRVMGAYWRATLQRCTGIVLKGKRPRAVLVAVFFTMRERGQPIRGNGIVPSGPFHVRQMRRTKYEGCVILAGRTASSPHKKAI